MEIAIPLATQRSIMIEIMGLNYVECKNHSEYGIKSCFTQDWWVTMDKRLGFKVSRMIASVSSNGQFRIWALKNEFYGARCRSLFQVIAIDLNIVPCTKKMKYKKIMNLGVWMNYMKFKSITQRLFCGNLFSSCNTRTYPCNSISVIYMNDGYNG